MNMKQFNVVFEDRTTKALTAPKVLLAETWKDAVDAAWEHHKHGRVGSGQYRIKSLVLLNHQDVIVAGNDCGDDDN